MDGALTGSGVAASPPGWRALSPTSRLANVNYRPSAPAKVLAPRPEGGSHAGSKAVSAEGGRLHSGSEALAAASTATDRLNASCSASVIRGRSG